MRYVPRLVGYGGLYLCWLLHYCLSRVSAAGLRQPAGDLLCLLAREPKLRNKVVLGHSLEHGAVDAQLGDLLGEMRSVQSEIFQELDNIGNLPILSAFRWANRASVRALFDVQVIDAPVGGVEEDLRWAPFTQGFAIVL